MSEPLLECEGLSKRFFDGRRRVEALVKVDLQVSRGEAVRIEGPSGSGKSTLLSILAGLSPPTSGDVRIEGRSIAHMRDAHRVAHCRTRIGYVAQSLGLIDGMSTLENILLPLVPTGGASKDDIARANALLEELGAAELIDARVDELSGGQRQRVAIARALIRAPIALLFDEPTAHLDDENVDAMVAILREQQRHERALLIASHDPRLLQALDGPRFRLVKGALTPSAAA